MTSFLAKRTNILYLKMVILLAEIIYYVKTIVGMWYDRCTFCNIFSKRLHYFV